MTICPEIECKATSKFIQGCGLFEKLLMCDNCTCIFQPNNRYGKGIIAKGYDWYYTFHQRQQLLSVPPKKEVKT